MPRDKDRAINPAAAQRKAEKQKAVRKGKAAVQAQRDERYAQRNPTRIQRQIEDLKALESSTGRLSERDRRVIGELEKDLARIQKAKASLGRKDTNGMAEQQDTSLGKRSRGRDYRRADITDSETDESVRNIPMPGDTPPPAPRPSRTDARDRDWDKQDQHPPIQAPTIYEAKPVIRNLRREAVQLIPSAIRNRLHSKKAQDENVQGRLESSS